MAGPSKTARNCLERFIANIESIKGDLISKDAVTAGKGASGIAYLDGWDKAVRETDPNEPIWAKDPESGVQEFGKQTFEAIANWYHREGIQKLLPAVCGTRVMVRDPDMPVQMRYLLSQFARTAAEGWVTGDEMLARRVYAIMEPSGKAYTSFGHEMRKGERDALNRNFRPLTEFAWAQQLWETEGERGNATIEVRLQNGTWKPAFLMGSSESGYKLQALLGEGDSVTDLTNTPENVAPSGKGAQWYQEVKMFKSAEIGGLQIEEEEEMLAGDEWRMALRPGSMVDCQHHTTAIFKAAVVTTVTPDDSAGAAAGAGGAGGEVQPQFGDSLGIHFIGYPTSHDWRVARGSPYIIRPRMCSETASRDNGGDAAEIAAIPDAYLDPVQLGWAKNDANMLQYAYESGKPMKELYRPYGMWRSTALFRAIRVFLDHPTIVGEDEDAKEEEAMYAIQKRLAAAAEKAGQLAAEEDLEQDKAPASGAGSKGKGKGGDDSEEGMLSLTMIEAGAFMLCKISDISSWTLASGWLRECAMHLCACCRRIPTKDVRNLTHQRIATIWRNLRHALRRSMPEASAARFHEPARMALIRYALRSDSLPCRLAGQIALNQLIYTVGHISGASAWSGLPSGAKFVSRHLRRVPSGGWVAREVSAWLDPVRLAGWLRGLNLVRDAFELRRHNSLWDQSGHAMCWLAAHGELPDSHLAIVWYTASTAGTKVGLSETAWQGLNAVAAYGMPRQRKLLLGWLMMLPQESWCDGALGLLRCLSGDLAPADKWCRLSGMNAGEAEVAWFKPVALCSGSLFPDGQPAEPSAAASGAGADAASEARPAGADFAELEGWDGAELKGARTASISIEPLTQLSTEGDLESGANSVRYRCPASVPIEVGQDDVECARVRCAALQLLLACASPVSVAAWRARVLVAGAHAASKASTWAETSEKEADIDQSRVRLSAWLALAAEAAARCSATIDGTEQLEGGAFDAAMTAAASLGKQANDMLPGNVAEYARDLAGLIIARVHLAPLLPGLARDAWAALSNGYATMSMSRVLLGCIDALRLYAPRVVDAEGKTIEVDVDDADRLLLDILGEGQIVSVWLKEMAEYRQRAREGTSFRSAALDTWFVDDPAEPPAPLLGCRPTAGSADPASGAHKTVKSGEKPSKNAGYYSLGSTPGTYLSGVANRLSLLAGCLKRCGPLMLEPSDIDQLWALLWSEGSTPGERGRLLHWFGDGIIEVFRKEVALVHEERSKELLLRYAAEEKDAGGQKDEATKKKKPRPKPLSKIPPEERVVIESAILGTDGLGSSPGVAARLGLRHERPILHGQCVSRLLLEHLEGHWISDDPSDLCDESDESGMKYNWSDAMSFLWIALQTCLNRSFLYVNHYGGRLHCSASTFVVQKVGERDSGLAGEGGFWRIALGGQDEAASSQASEKLAALLSQLQGEAQKQRSTMMASYLRRAVMAIRTAVARARMEVPPAAASSMRRLPSIGILPRATSTGSVLDEEEDEGGDADLSKEMPEEADFDDAGLPGEGSDPEFVQKRCSELAARAVRTLVSLVSGDSSASTGRLGMHAPDAIVGWSSASEMNLCKPVSISVSAIVTDQSPATGAGGAASGAGASPEPAGVQSPGKPGAKVTRHKASTVVIQPYESLAEVKLELCAAIEADPFTAYFTYAAGSKLEGSMMGQPICALPSMHLVKTLILRAMRAGDEPIGARPVNSLAPALLARWSQAHGVLLEAIDAASDVNGRPACLPLPAATVQSLWTILSRCPTEPEIEARVRQLSSVASVPVGLRSFDRPLLPQDPEASAHQGYSGEPDLASGLQPQRSDLSSYLMRRSAALREGAHCTALLPPGSVGAPVDGSAATEALDEALTPEDMEAVLPTDSPARLLYGLVALRKLIIPQSRLRQWATTRCRRRIGYNSALELYPGAYVDGCRAHEADAEAEESHRIRWRRKFFAGGIGIAHLIKALKASTAAAAYGSTRKPEAAAVATAGSAPLPEASEGVEWLGEPGAWRVTASSWVSGAAAAECSHILQAVWTGSVLPLLQPAVQARKYLLDVYGAYQVSRADVPECCGPRTPEYAALQVDEEGRDLQAHAISLDSIAESTAHTWLERYPGRNDAFHAPCPLVPEDISLYIQEIGLEVEYVRSLGPWAVSYALARWPEREAVQSHQAELQAMQDAAVTAASGGSAAHFAGSSALDWSQLGTPLVGLMWRAVCMRREGSSGGQALAAPWRRAAMNASICLPLLLGACPSAWNAVVGASPASAKSLSASLDQPPCTLAEAIVGSALLHGNNARWGPLRDACAKVPRRIVETARVVRRFAGDKVEPYLAKASATGDATDALAASHVPEEPLLLLLLQNRPRRVLAASSSSGAGTSDGTPSSAEPMRLTTAPKAVQYCGEYLDAVNALLRMSSGHGPNGCDSLSSFDLIEREERSRENNGREDQTDYGDTITPLPERPLTESAEAEVRKEVLQAPKDGGPFVPIDACRVLPWLQAELRAAVGEVRAAFSGPSTEDWVQGGQDGRLCSALQFLASAAECSETARIWLAQPAPAFGESDGTAGVAELLLEGGLFSIGGKFSKEWASTESDATGVSEAASGAGASVAKRVVQAPWCKKAVTRRSAFALIAALFGPNAPVDCPHARRVLLLTRDFMWEGRGEPAGKEGIADQGGVALLPWMPGVVTTQTRFDPSRSYRSATGHLGIRNLGCICYMIALLQQFFSIERLRLGVLQADAEGVLQRKQADVRARLAGIRAKQKWVKEQGIDEPEEGSEPQDLLDVVEKAKASARQAQAKKKSNVGYGGDMLCQLQRMFGFLDRANSQCYDPTQWLVGFKDRAGKPTKPFIQYDAQEFLGLLCERLDSSMAGLPQRRILDATIRGRSISALSRQDGKGSVKWRSEEDWVCIQCEVRGRTSLLESLGALADGDPVDGYRWQEEEDGPSEETTVLKRSCVSQLPDTLVLHLKRFDLDYTTFETIKVNDRFEFPETLDMWPYTREGVAWENNKYRLAKEAETEAAGAAEVGAGAGESKEADDRPDGEGGAAGGGGGGGAGSEPPEAKGEGEKVAAKAEKSAEELAAEAEAQRPYGEGLAAGRPREYYQYDLVGVVVHLGTTDSGHYYSYIRERGRRGKFRAEQRKKSGVAGISKKQAAKEREKLMRRAILAAVQGNLDDDDEDDEDDGNDDDEDEGVPEKPSADTDGGAASGAGADDTPKEGGDGDDGDDENWRGEWMEFNDNLVTPFDPSRIPDECFGGHRQEMRMQRDGTYVEEKVENSYNAYMLVYERRKSFAHLNVHERVQGEEKERTQKAIEAAQQGNDYKPTPAEELCTKLDAKEYTDLDATQLALQKAFSPDDPSTGVGRASSMLSKAIEAQNQQQMVQRQAFDPMLSSFMVRACRASLRLVGIVPRASDPFSLSQDEQDLASAALARLPHDDPVRLALHDGNAAQSGAGAAAGDDDKRLQVDALRTIQWLVAYARLVFVHGTSQCQSQSRGFFRPLRRLLGRFAPAAPWLLRRIRCDPKGYQYLIDCWGRVSNAEVRSGFTALVVQALARLRPYEGPRYREQRDEDVEVETKDSKTGKKKMVIVTNKVYTTETALFIDLWMSETVCNIMIPAWKYFDQFHEVIERFAYMGAEPRALLDDLQAASIYLDWFMGEKSIIGDRTNRLYASKARTSAQGSKTYTPQYETLLRAVSIMLRACSAKAQFKGGAPAPPTLVTYGHTEPNAQDVETQKRSVERSIRIADYNRTRGSRPEILNAASYDYRTESKMEGYVPPLPEIDDLSMSVLSDPAFWRRCIQLGSGRDSLPQLAAHLVWYDGAISLNPVMPVLLGQHQDLPYARVGIVEEILEAVLETKDFLQPARLELAVASRYERMRDQLYRVDASADPLIYAMRNDEYKYPDAAREAALFVVRLARRHKVVRDYLVERNCRHLDLVERILRSQISGDSTYFRSDDIGLSIGRGADALSDERAEVVLARHKSNDNPPSSLDELRLAVRNSIAPRDRCIVALDALGQVLRAEGRSLLGKAEIAARREARLARQSAAAGDVAAAGGGGAADAGDAVSSEELVDRDD